MKEYLRLVRGGALSLAILLGACRRGASAELPPGEPYASGAIESITHHATGSGILVRPAPGSPDACGISATADDATRFLVRTGTGAPRPLDRSELAVGDLVDVYVDGPVALSCPPQGHATVIVRVGRAPGP